MKKYQIIYADPPWEYRDKYNGNNNRKYNVINPAYPIMRIDDIYNLPVSTIADENSILFLWVLFPMLQEGLNTVKAWGFKYKTLGFNWVKLNSKSNTPWFGIGHYTKSSSEICVIGMKGKLRNIKISDKVHSLVQHPRERHSAKPPCVREKIVEFAGDRPRIELFARQKTPGWDVWGNEVESDIELATNR